MNTGIRKARYYLSAYRKWAIVLCTVVLLLSMVGAAFMLAAPPSTDVTDITHEETISSSVTTETTVQEDSELYSEGETLQNKPLYFYQTTPTVNLTATTDGPTSNDIVGTKTLSLVYEVETSDGESLWTDEETLTSASIDGDTTETRATLDMTAIRDRYNAIESDTDGDATILVKLVLTVDYQTNDYDDQINATQPITISSSSYSISQFSEANSHQETEQNTRPIPTQATTISLPMFGDLLIPHRTIWLLFLASIAGGVGVAAVRLENIDPAAERDAIHQLRYDEWISKGTIPSDHDYTVATVDSLEGLVNTAIDLDKRVLYDGDEECYAVFDFSIIYVYSDSRQARDQYAKADQMQNSNAEDEDHDPQHDRSEDQHHQSVDQEFQFEDLKQTESLNQQSEAQSHQSNVQHQQPEDQQQTDEHDDSNRDPPDDFDWGTEI